jgi:hypothetical protein
MLRLERRLSTAACLPVEASNLEVFGNLSFRNFENSKFVGHKNRLETVATRLATFLERFE